MITTYNRPKALKSCVEAIQNVKWPLPFEVLVSDDASTEANLQQIKQIKGIRLLTSEVNTGLGANLNRALKAAKGDFILYCQEDFLLKKEVSLILEDVMEYIESRKLDLIRFKANFRFPRLIPMSTSIYRIPRWSWKNFLVNTFQYSDNPFVTHRRFFEELGYFMEDVRSDYGETEFAIRVLNFKKRIGITQPYMADTNTTTQSTLRVESTIESKRKKRKLRKYLRACRQYVEWIFYRKNKRGLLTYSKN